MPDQEFGAWIAPHVWDLASGGDGALQPGKTLQWMGAALWNRTVWQKGKRKGKGSLTFEEKRDCWCFWRFEVGKVGGNYLSEELFTSKVRDSDQSSVLEMTSALLLRYRNAPFKFLYSPRQVDCWGGREGMRQGDWSMGQRHIIYCRSDDNAIRSNLSKPYWTHSCFYDIWPLQIESIRQSNLRLRSDLMKSSWLVNSQYEHNKVSDCV